MKLVVIKNDFRFEGKQLEVGDVFECRNNRLAENLIRTGKCGLAEDSVEASEAAVTEETAPEEEPKADPDEAEGTQEEE